MANKRQRNQKNHIIIWAHSDQAGGTELASLLASALRRKGGPQIRIGIVTPKPDSVKDFFKCEINGLNGIDIIKIVPGLRLNTDPNSGNVSPFMTLDLIKSLSTTPIDHQVKYYKKILNGRYDDSTLIISCGDPFALKVAKILDPQLKAITITDHLITQSLKCVLEKAGCFYKKDVGDYLNMLQSFDLLGEESFLAPPEFGMPEYANYLSQGARKCLEMGGVFYDPIPEPELNRAPHYKELLELNRRYPVVIVFGGGGNVWNRIYLELFNQAAKKNGLREFALVIRDVQNAKVIPRSWRLFEPGGMSMPLNDPGKMMYWYAASTLLVGRGGLAAQQILATMISPDIKTIPGMLFVEEPGHPQIESERIMLGRMGLVFSCCLQEFINNPFDIIKDILSQRQIFKSIKDRARIRYSTEATDRLASYILTYYQ